jgi:hypothetical protein
VFGYIVYKRYITKDLLAVGFKNVFDDV